MTQSIKQISCPNCQHSFDVEDVLATQIEQKYKARYEAERSKVLNDLALKNKELNAEKEKFEAAKKRENEIFQKRLEDRVKTEIINKEKTLKSQIQDEFSIKLKARDEEITNQRQRISKMQETELELEKLKTKMQDQRKEIEIEMQRTLRNKVQEREEQIAKRIQEENELRLKEKDKMLNDQKKLIEEMKRKAEQGSMQMQGEIQELAIEELLAQKFPFDTVEEVGKGMRGADTILKVMNDLQQPCGSIIIESKRTKNWVNDWLDKLKKDQQSAGAQLAIIVTETMPSELSKFGELKGVYVCKYNELISLIYVLRKMLISLQEVKNAQSNKGDKMENLYDYLTGVEFKNRIGNIAESFNSMKEDLDREKRAMARLWKTREKQIEMITDNTLSLYASVKAIGGKAIAPISSLELPGTDELID